MKQETLFKARELRKNPTEAEQLLWQLLRKRQLFDCRFRRQHPFPPYIVDFYCPAKNLIIELDGGQHQDRQEYDRERSRFLNSLGKQVLRFWNHQVIEETGGVIDVIRQYMQTPP